MNNIVVLDDVDQEKEKVENPRCFWHEGFWFLDYFFHLVKLFFIVFGFLVLAGATY